MDRPALLMLTAAIVLQVLIPAAGRNERLYEYSQMTPSEARCKACENPLSRDQLLPLLQASGKTLSEYLEYVCQAVRDVEGSSWTDSDMNECKEKARQDAVQYANGVDAAVICGDCNQRRRRGSANCVDRWTEKNKTICSIKKAKHQCFRKRAMQNCQKTCGFCSTDLNDRLRTYSHMSPAEARCKACQTPKTVAEMKQIAQARGKTIGKYLRAMCQAVRYVHNDEGGIGWTDSDMYECRDLAKQDARQFANGVDGAVICGDCKKTKK